MDIYVTASGLENLRQVLSTLVSRPTAKAIVAYLSPPGEFVTPENLRDRLHALIRVGDTRMLLSCSQRRKLQAVLDLGNILNTPNLDSGLIMREPEFAISVFQQVIGWENVEKFAVAILDVKHKLLALKVISSGDAEEAIASPRLIFEAVILAGGTRCIIAHNHPSGCASPSSQDHSLTAVCLQAAQVMNIPILDHIIVGKGSSCSVRSVTTLWQQFPQENIGDSQR